MLIVLVTPPPIKPSEPGLSAHAAAQVLRGMGARAVAVDASIGWHRFALDPARLAATLARADAAGASLRGREALRRAVRDTCRPFRDRATYADRKVYTSAVNELENALRLAASPWPSLRLGIASVAPAGGGRLECAATLARLADEAGPFDEYCEAELFPRLETLGATHVGVSLAYQFQAPAAFRLAALLARRLPGVRRLLGGPLVACWAAAFGEAGLRRPPFDLFDEVIPGSPDDMARLAAALGGDPGRGAPEGQGRAPLAVAFDEADWDLYLAPAPVIPAALGRGCPWRRCTFCPDHLHPPHDPCSPGALEAWLRAVAARFTGPAGAMLHLTDSALPPRHLRRLAETIRRDRLPIAWHGFARVDPPFADPGFARALAEGGCALLQLGVETASPRLLERLGKGLRPDAAERAIGALSDAGIRVQVYLLFGLPGETEEDREATLALIERLAGRVHAINAALLNLPRGSPMHRDPAAFGITDVVPFHGDTDLSLYDDFRCGPSHPRLEARRWLGRRFLRSPAVRAIGGDLRTPFKANHLCFIDAAA